MVPRFWVELGEPLSLLVYHLGDVWQALAGTEEGRLGSGKDGRGVIVVLLVAALMTGHRGDVLVLGPVIGAREEVGKELVVEDVIHRLLGSFKTLDCEENEVRNKF